MDGSSIPMPVGACDTQASVCRNPTISEVLDERATRLTAELASVNAARDALKANPEITKVIDLVSKVVRGNY